MVALHNYTLYKKDRYIFYKTKRKVKFNELVSGEIKMVNKMVMNKY